MTHGEPIADGPRAEAPEPDPLEESIDPLLRVFRSREREAKRLRKAFDGLRKGGLDRLEAVSEARAVLERFDPEELGEETEQFADFSASLERRAARMATKARMKLLGELEEAAEEEDVSYRKLGDRPLTILLSPLTFECDVDHQTAAASFGKESIEGDIELKPKTLLEARRDLVARLKEESVASETFFERLEHAYRVLLELEGESEGERVDLVDTMVPLSLVSSEIGSWRKKGIDALEPFPRYLLAYQLWQLRRDGLLEHDGRRLDLGTATGGSTKDKRDVVFVPTTATEGQYYVSMRLTDTGERSSR